MFTAKELFERRRQRTRAKLRKSNSDQPRLVCIGLLGISMRKLLMILQAHSCRVNSDADLKQR